jgi:hypothetical protein
MKKQPNPGYARVESARSHLLAKPALEAASL